tara:strand:+ start:119 stop:382 length:264 start_codon:yes stop_codon:yes gene_type:complete
MDENLVFLEPRETFDPMIIGVAQVNHNAVLVYDQDALIKHWKEDFADEETSEEEVHLMAVEWYEYNVQFGEHTPIYVSRDSFDLADL